jgi:hypothetical protein
MAESIVAFFASLGGGSAAGAGVGATAAEVTAAKAATAAAAKVGAAKAAVATVGIQQGVSAAGQAKTAAREQMIANRAAQRQQDLKIERNKKAQIAQSKVLRARAISRGEASGAGIMGSATQGQVAGSGTNLAASLSLTDQLQGLEGSVFERRQRAANAQGRSNLSSAVSSLFLNEFGGADTISRGAESIFT